MAELCAFFDGSCPYQECPAGYTDHNDLLALRDPQTGQRCCVVPLIGIRIFACVMMAEAILCLFVGVRRLFVVYTTARQQLRSTNTLVFFSFYGFCFSAIFFATHRLRVDGAIGQDVGSTVGLSVMLLFGLMILCLLSETWLLVVWSIPKNDRICGYVEMKQLKMINRCAYGGSLCFS